MNGKYEISNGDVWFRPKADGRGPGMFSTLKHICRGSEDLAIAILDDCMVKCGEAVAVENWVAKNSGVFDVTVVRFPVSEETVAELNACAENSNRAAILIERLTEIGNSNPELSARPRYPV